MEEEVRDIVKEIRKDQDTLIDTFRRFKKALLISPAVMWAQSLNHTVFTVKLSHRVDAPACLDVYDETVELTNTTFYIEAYCRRGEDRYRFKQNVTFYEPIDVEESTW